ncbi:MAG: hypothetical protein EZS28_017126 [Streblomastix strix]|uniref:Uncharacterized protein n=1 Tax=Streblomastix strix TaxID=222440 RepID=A0A5J4VXI9_9EUKA|nr:MAG: hypothetical protein EZS28_017126 [Streblomastix strix]
MGIRFVDYTQSKHVDVLKKKHQIRSKEYGTPPVIRRADLVYCAQAYSMEPRPFKNVMELINTRLLIQSLLFHLFAGLCVLTPLSREGYMVAKGGRGQLALLQVVFYNTLFHY